VGSGRRGTLVAVVALVLTVNNGAFSALAAVGLNQSGGIARATTTPSGSLDDSAATVVPPVSTLGSHAYRNGDLRQSQIELPNTSTLASDSSDPTPARMFLFLVLLAQAVLLTLAFRRWREQ
jgi:hypothetical protein